MIPIKVQQLCLHRSIRHHPGPRSPLHFINKRIILSHTASTCITIISLYNEPMLQILIAGSDLLVRSLFKSQMQVVDEDGESYVQPLIKETICNWRFYIYWLFYIYYNRIRLLIRILTKTFRLIFEMTYFLFFTNKRITAVLSISTASQNWQRILTNWRNATIKYFSIKREIEFWWNKVFNNIMLNHVSNS